MGRLGIEGLPEPVLGQVFSHLLPRLSVLLVCKAWLHVALEHCPEWWGNVHVRGEEMDQRVVRGWQRVAGQCRRLRIDSPALLPELLSLVDTACGQLEGLAVALSAQHTASPSGGVWADVVEASQCALHAS
jgi:hypothetical protein